MFSPERNFLDWNVCDFNGQPARLFETIESTHSHMKDLARQGAIPAGTVFIADRQSAGRGRHERTWESPAGKNVYFNVLIPLEGIPAARYPQITQIAALTFAEVFRHMQDDALALDGAAGSTEDRVTVKWPNDILCGKSKFCGILSEVVFMPASEGKPQPALSMGVGINVNSDPSEYAFLQRAVTTLKAIAHRPVNREKLMQALVGNLQRAIGQFKAFGISPWVEAWRKMDQFIGAKGTIFLKDAAGIEHKKEGRILDMEQDGSLRFQTESGDVQIVYSADLEI